MNRFVAAAVLLALSPLAAATGPLRIQSEPYELPTPADPFHLILHDPVGRPAPSTACDVDLCRSLVALIDSAEETLDLAIYGLRGQPAIFEALVRAQQRGVQVRGVVDRTTDGRNYYKDTDRLVKALGTVRDDLAVDIRTAATREPYDPEASRCWMARPEGFDGPAQCVGYAVGDDCLLAVHASREMPLFEGEIMHDKYVVADGRYLWMGSTNLSDSGTGGYNANLVGLWNAPELASWYVREFEQMYAGAFHRSKKGHGPMHTTLHGGIRVQALFTPQDTPIDQAVRPLIQQARQRIDVGIFFLTHKGIARDLIAAHERGVRVRVILDATAARNGYTKHELLRAAGIPVKIENWGGKMHMKSAAIDGEVVIMGSMNWTSAGNHTNDENTLIVQHEASAARYHAFFDELWAAIPDRWLHGRPDPESLDSTTACTDGTDNDFDHLDDAEDPGCGTTPPALPPLPSYVRVPRAGGDGVLKGNISSAGNRTFHVPGGEYYDRVRIDENIGEGWFCSEEDAMAAGFRRSGR